MGEKIPLDELARQWREISAMDSSVKVIRAQLPALRKNK